jgi:hypothetical protein
LALTSQFGTQEHPISISLTTCWWGGIEREREREREGKKKKRKLPRIYKNINTYQVLPNTTPLTLALNRVNYKQEQHDKILISPSPFQDRDKALCTCPI